jgi:hypothetical protein
MRQKAPELRSLNAVRGDRGNSLRPSTPSWNTLQPHELLFPDFLPILQSLIAALSSAPTADFALHGELLSLVWPRESNQREGHPGIRPRLRRGSLLPALLRGPSRWDVLSHRSSLGVLPRVPLRNTSTRPTDGDSGTELLGSPSRCCALLIVPTLCVGVQPLALCANCLLCGACWPVTRSVTGWVPTQSVGMIGKGIQNFQTTPNTPFRRPNGIIAEGVERHGCHERRDGPRMALRGVPLER